MRIITYYTAGTPYERECERLLASALRLKLPVLAVAVNDQGSWHANTAQKVEVLRANRDEYEGALLYVDSDAVLWADPRPIARQAIADHDIAMHRYRGAEWLTGTMVIADTAEAREVLDAWSRYNAVCRDRGEKKRGGQRNLATVLEYRESCRVAELPPELCYIFDLSRSHYPWVKRPIVEHLQASRENRRSMGGGQHAGRTRRVGQVERALGLRP